MGIKLSHSAAQMYSQCGRKYKHHYIDRLRSRYLSGALIFGTAVDRGLTHLLETKNLEESLQLFDKSFRFNTINNVPQYIPDNVNIVYAKKDFDKDLLTEEDLKDYQEYKEKNNIVTGNSLEADISYVLDQKEQKGLKALTSQEVKIYNYANWLSMRRKGHVMLKSYNEKILPKIKEVLSLQKKITLTNSQDDQVDGYIDLIVELHDGKRYILDNKTSTREYDKNAPMNSQQLIIYYHSEKEEMKLDGVGFIVMYKQILKNRTKECKVCKKNGTGQRHKTCDNIINNVRCNGEWIEGIDPEARIELLLNEVPEVAETLVIETFDEANEGIKRKVFNPNLTACGSGEYLCNYWAKCWRGSEEDLVKLETKI